MTEQSRKYLVDILQSIELIHSFLEGIESFGQYEADVKTQSAIERQLGIIGEAVNKFQKKYPGEKLENTHQIIGFRNRIIHAYDSIDNSIVWVIIKKYLTPLKHDIERKFLD